MNLVDFYSALLLGFLATPAGVAAIFMAGVLAICSLTVPSARWAFVAAAVYAATLPINSVTSLQAGYYVPLAFPLEQIRVYARPLTLAFLIILLLPLITSGRGWRRTLISWPLTLFFAFEIGIALRLTSVDALNRGPLSLASYTLLFLTFGIGVSIWLQDIGDVYKLLYAIAGAAATLIVATCYQLAINRTPIFSGNRLSGVTGNPNFLALFMAFTTPTASFLVLNGSKKWRPVFAIQAVLSLIMILWTGTRGGFLGVAIGLIVLFHRRLGRAIIFIVIIGGLLMLLLPYFEGSTVNASRLLSTENTRASVWAYMFNNFRSAPWFGVSRGDLEVSENSYLAMLSQVGIVGSLPFVAAWLAMAYQIIRLQVTRSWLGEHQGLVDLVSAYWVSMAACAVFEGFLLGVLVFAVLILYLFAAITTYLADHIAAVRAQQHQAAADPADPWQLAA